MIEPLPNPPVGSVEDAAPKRDDLDEWPHIHRSERGFRASDSFMAESQRLSEIGVSHLVCEQVEDMGKVWRFQIRTKAPGPSPKHFDAAANSLRHESPFHRYQGTTSGFDPGDYESARAAFPHDRFNELAVKATRSKAEEAEFYAFTKTIRPQSQRNVTMACLLDGFLGDEPAMLSWLEAHCVERRAAITESESGIYARFDELTSKEQSLSKAEESEMFWLLWRLHAKATPERKNWLSKRACNIFSRDVHRKHTTHPREGGR